MEKNRRDNHHMLFSEYWWSGQAEANELRSRSVVNLYRDIHNDIHVVSPPIVLLSKRAIQECLRMYPRQHRTPLASIDTLMGAIEGSHRKVFGIERELSLIALESLEHQRGFMQEQTRLDGKSLII